MDRPVFNGFSEHPDTSGIPISMQCGACHDKVFKEWAGSHHAWANREIVPSLDAEPFQGEEVKDGKSIWKFTGTVEPNLKWTDPDAETIDQRPDMVIGVTPLVQYLIDIGEGRWQAPDMAWDTENEEWFSIYEGQGRRPHEWGHWTQRGMNWNSQCAWCHMTEYRKNYDVESGAYASTWKEQGIGCTQCHGGVTNTTDAGACMIEIPQRYTPEQWMDSCMTCHSRREELDEDFVIGSNYHDHYRLALPSQPNLWHPDGHQLDEVYVTTGLLLSKMGHAGVTCLDCHAVHETGAKLPVDDNQVCMQCHGPGTEVGGKKAQVINQLEHMFHDIGTEGGRCVDCHMMKTPYMGRDPRRDHSFGIPDPLLTKELGVPNACSKCHEEEGIDWAIEWVDKWYGEKMDRPERIRTRAVAKAYEAAPDALEALLDYYPREEISAWKATLLRLMAPWAADERVDAHAREAAGDGDPLVRAAAAHLLARRPDRASLVATLRRDPVRAVRFEAAWTGLEQLPLDSPAMAEVTQIATHQADQPSGAYRLARVAMVKNDPVEAERWFAKAMAWDRSSPAARRDYAVFLASQGRTAEAIRPLRDAMALDRENPELPYLLGLAYAEAGNSVDALKQLAEAVRRDPGFSRAHYNIGLLLSAQGKPQEAIKALRRAEKADPVGPDAPYARATIHARLGEGEAAAAAAREALRRAPGFAPARRLLQQLGRGR